MEKRSETMSKGCESPGLTYSGGNNKKNVKHALSQQVKRRRKNTTIAAGNSRSVPHILSKTSMSQLQQNDGQVSMNSSNLPLQTNVEEPVVTMKDVLASLPGFSNKYNRKRSTKRLSLAAQLKAGLIDLETPTSILTSTSLRMLLNRHTFQGLPSLYQRKLAQLLPIVDRQDAAISGLNNEFFARACLEWRKRLAEGEFTPENQQRIRTEAEKDKNKLDPWKLKHFEPIWGEKREHKLKLNSQNEDLENVCCRFLYSNQVPNHSGMDSLIPSRQTRSMVDEKGDLISTKDINSDLMNIDLQVINEDEDVDDDEDDDDEDDEDDNVEEEEYEDNMSVQEEYDYNEEEEEDIEAVGYYNDADDDEDEDGAEEESEESQNSEKYIQKNYSQCVDTLANDTRDTNENPDISQNSLLQEASTGDSSKSCKTDDKNKFSVIDADEQKGVFEKTLQEENTLDQSNSDVISNTVEELEDVIEIDSETLQCIQELEVRGEIEETYEEISNPAEQVIYPILDEMEINTNSSEVPETILVDESFTLAPQSSPNTGPEEEAFQDAHNYVCSEMMESTWISSTKVSEIPSEKGEDITDSWPISATTSLKDQVSSNTSEVSFENCEVEKPSDGIKLMSEEELLSSVNSSTLIKNQSIFSNATVVVTPSTNCLKKDVPSPQTSTVIAFPQLQSIRFIQTNFHTAATNNMNDTFFSHQNSEINNQIVDARNLLESQNMASIENNSNIYGLRDIFGNKLLNNPMENDPMSHAAPILIQQQKVLSLAPVTKVISTIQHEQQLNQVTPITRPSNRGTKSNNKSRNNSTKTPPGTVNLERSYQICQAVIANSPNRDQLKAQLRLPPGLAATNKSKVSPLTKKSQGKVSNVVAGKVSKTSQMVDTDDKSIVPNNKTQNILSKQVAPCEDKKLMNIAIQPNNLNQLVNQGVVLKKTEIGESPRALSAPPLPPECSDANVTSQSFRGRPASVGGSHTRRLPALPLKIIRSTENRRSNQLNNELGDSQVSSENGMVVQSECGSQEPMIICRKCGVYCHNDCGDANQQLCTDCNLR